MLCWLNLKFNLRLLLMKSSNKKDELGSQCDMNYDSIKYKRY